MRVTDGTAAGPMVTLTPDELYQAAIVGVHRRITCIFGRKKEQHYDASAGDEWATEIESCCAELAVSKYFNRYWAGGVFNGQRAASDVDGKQVRHSVHAGGHLIIYPEDKPTDAYFLVTGKAPVYVLRGWRRGAKVIGLGKEHEWWRTKNVRSPSWWVPQSALIPVPEPK
jgi:hypothetical protein